MLYEKMCAVLTAQLKKSMIVLTLLLALCGQSCKTVKTNQQIAQQQQTEQKNNLHIQQQVKEQVTITTQTIDQTAINEEEEETIEETFWSAPDSTGKQYPISTRTITRNTRKGQQNDTKTSIKNEVQSREQQSAEDHSIQIDKIEEENNSKTETKKQVPMWIIVAIVGIIVMVGLILFALLKRYKIL